MKSGRVQPPAPPRWGSGRDEEKTTKEGCGKVRVALLRKSSCRSTPSTWTAPSAASSAWSAPPGPGWQSLAPRTGKTVAISAAAVVRVPSGAPPRRGRIANAMRPAKPHLSAEARRRRRLTRLAADPGRRMRGSSRGFSTDARSGTRTDRRSRRIHSGSSTRARRRRRPTPRRSRPSCRCRRASACRTSTRQRNYGRNVPGHVPGHGRTVPVHSPGSELPASLQRTPVAGSGKRLSNCSNPWPATIVTISKS